MNHSMMHREATLNLSSVQVLSFCFLVAALHLLVEIIRTQNLSQLNFTAKPLMPPMTNIPSVGSHLVYELESFNQSFYVYTDPDITQEDRPRTRAPIYYKRYGHEAETEIIIHEILRKSPLRVENADDADMFIVPIYIGEILTTRGLSWDEPFQALLSHPVYKQYQGNKHIIISLPLVTYQYFNRRNVPGLLSWLPRIVNITAALGCDPVAVWEAYQSGKLKGNDYEEPFSKTFPMSHHSFSIGIGLANRDFPITPASFEKFNNSTFFIFYNTVPGTSFFDSTKFRHAPVVNVSLAALPYSSIGMDPLPKDEWLTHFRDSKFCLAIRGDNPQSHALLRSVRAGCIPVVVSDLWPFYAPALKSSLRIEQYSIMITEADFISNPQRSLLKLADINTTMIKEKIAYLSLAQRVLLPDHPESLFVPAFLKEAMVSMEKTSPAFF